MLRKKGMKQRGLKVMMDPHSSLYSHTSNNTHKLNLQEGGDCLFSIVIRNSCKPTHTFVSVFLSETVHGIAHYLPL